MLTHFVNAAYDITTRKIDNLTGDFNASIKMKHHSHSEFKGRNGYQTHYHKEKNNKSINVHFGSFQIYIFDGEIVAGIKGKWPNWKDNKIVAPNKIFSLSVKRKGIIYTVSLNGNQVFIARFPNLKFNNIRFESKSKFEIHSIKIEQL